ncbi:MAG TPA: hypothetical protein VMB20_14020, partial [Candidatus Acidoferrum sp.]|nr:hypothetical protein [Candidatus Acidoferrum sp.]
AYTPGMMTAYLPRIAVAVLCAFTLVSAAPPPAGSMAAVHHLVYRFGYNGPADDQGKQTGTTTVDITGPASDGGMTVTMLDEWWHQSRPRQQFTCEVYPNGGVKCAQPPYAISPIQVTLLPLLAQHYFSGLSGGANASWSVDYTVRATFLPQASGGFAGQVYTWKCAYTLTGQGTVPNDAPILLIHREGQMVQQGGPGIKVNQKTRIAFDPRIHVPIVVGEEVTLVPKMTTNRYIINLRLIKTGTK